jgi:DNA-binding response OmpR family regulator
MKSNSILVIDNDVEYLTFVMDFLTIEMKLNQVAWAVSSKDAENKINTFNPDIVILDLGMKETEKLSSLIKNKPVVPVLLITTYYSNEDYNNLVIGMGADGFFLKDEVKTALPKLMKFFNTDFYDRLRKNIYIMN